jgi:hypothetical protein
MRTPIYVLVAALFIGGCSTHYHAPASQPVDRVRVPEPDPVEPLELDIGRPVGSQLLLQTNRPAYVAIFEIVPNRGVTLIYPAAAHQQNMLVSGLTWVPLWWSPRRASLTSDRYIYAVASEEPLRLSGETFHVGYFHRVLGPGIYRAERPYSTMRAISREIVPNVAEEEWAEDVHVLTPTYHLETFRTVRIYCPGSRVFDVPEDMLARIWCPTRTRVIIVEAGRPRTRDYPVGRPARPDSVYGHGGGRIKFEPPRRRGPIIRVVDPTGRDRDDRDDRGRARDSRPGGDRDERDDESEKPEKPEKPKRGRIIDLINEVERAKQEKEQEKERERQEREDRRREAEEARRREAEEREDARRREAEEREARRREAEERRDERKDERRDERDARKDERDERKDERKDERQEERDARKDEREERRDDRRDEPKQQGQAREEKQEQKQEEKREEKQEKREEKQEKREEPRDDNKGRRSVRDLIKDKKEKP